MVSVSQVATRLQETNRGYAQQSKAFSMDTAHLPQRHGHQATCAQYNNVPYYTEARYFSTTLPQDKLFGSTDRTRYQRYSQNKLDFVV